MNASEKTENREKRNARIAVEPGGLAVWTGLEPATSCVTGRHSNQAELPDLVWDGKCRILPEPLQETEMIFSYSVALYSNKSTGFRFGYYYPSPNPRHLSMQAKTVS
jgi:hypothetical protein